MKRGRISFLVIKHEIFTFNFFFVVTLQFIVIHLLLVSTERVFFFVFFLFSSWFRISYKQTTAVKGTIKFGHKIAWRSKVRNNSRIKLKISSRYHCFWRKTAQKKWSFPLRISSVNVTKSTVSFRFDHIYWKNP